MGSVTSSLLRLLELHGAQVLEAAIAEALTAGVPHLAAIRQLLDSKRHLTGEPPRIAVELPNDPRIRDLVVHPHSLDDYEHLNEESQDEKDPDSDS